MTATLKIKNDRYYAVVNYKEGAEYKQKWIALGLPAKNNKRKAEAMLGQHRTIEEKRWLIKKRSRNRREIGND